MARGQSLPGLKSAAYLQHGEPLARKALALWWRLLESHTSANKDVATLRPGLIPNRVPFMLHHEPCMSHREPSTDIVLFSMLHCISFVTSCTACHMCALSATSCTLYVTSCTARHREALPWHANTAAVLLSGPTSCSTVSSAT